VGTPGLFRRAGSIFIHVSEVNLMFSEISEPEGGDRSRKDRQSFVVKKSRRGCQSRYPGRWITLRHHVPLEKSRPISNMSVLTPLVSTCCDRPSDHLDDFDNDVNLDRGPPYGTYDRPARLSHPRIAPAYDYTLHSTSGCISTTTYAYDHELV
jgi:hypothetical protein